MSAARDIRLLRVPSLRAAHRAVMLVACHADAAAAPPVVLVPSRAAADELQLTLARHQLEPGWQPPRAAYEAVGMAHVPASSEGRALPRVLTREEWYVAMQEAAAPGARMLSSIERETLLGASAREAAAQGNRPPFRMAPGLIAQMLEFYDALQRRLRSVADFDRLLTTTLTPTVELDRGAARMLQQTRFLAESFQRFEARCGALDALDEHRLRVRVCHADRPVGLRQLVVTLPDQAADSDGLWPADFDLIARLPGVDRVDVISTEARLATGLLERLHDRLPGLVECRPDLGRDVVPRLLVPAEGSAAHFTSRDRENELADVLSRLVSRTTRGGNTAASDPPLHLVRCGLVYQRPLPYLYLARQLMDSADLPYEAIDALPLASEPYVAAVDLVVSFVASSYTRVATVAMLGSPHLQFVADGLAVTGRHVAALDARLAELGYLGGREHLEALTEALAGEPCWPAAAAAAGAARELDALATAGRCSELLSTLIEFLERHDRAPEEHDPTAGRRSRARAALLDTLRLLRDAELRFGDDQADIGTLRTVIRRWIEGQTFAPRTGGGGLRLTDVRAAAYGDFDAVHLLGLVEGEWPATPAHNIFFPSALLRELGWTAEADRLAYARAAFVDLLYLARREMSASTFSLEDDAIVRSSPLLEEVADAELAHEPIAAMPGLHGAQMSLPDLGARWTELRAGRSRRDDPRFHGFTGLQPGRRYRVTAIETYLACPFKYFAAHELGLGDETSTDGTLTPLERGRLVHEILEDFFASWPPGMPASWSPHGVKEARARFQGVVERHLASLPAAERHLELQRFMGTAAAMGIADRVLMVEALLEGMVVERFLEHDLRGEHRLAIGRETVARVVRGKADRIDLLEGGRLRVLDYKSGKAPPLARALQLPVYAACAEREFEGRHGRSWTAAEAAYVPLAGPKLVVSVIDGPEARDAAVARAERLLSEALGGIETGRFPPRPSELRLCATCAFAAVCRLDYVDVDPV